MKADINLLREYGRMCKGVLSCASCPIEKYRKGHKEIKSIDCHELLRDYTEIAEQIIKVWSEQHPQKTYKDDFFEKFPKAPKDEDGYPVCMPCEIYSSQSDVSCVICGECEKFWDEAYEE